MNIIIQNMGILKLILTSRIFYKLYLMKRVNPIE